MANDSFVQRWVREGDSFRDAGSPARAAEAYRRALERQPELSSVRVQMGNMLKDAGHYQEAEDAYRAALTHGANVSDTNVQLGRALRLAGRREDALQAFVAALKADSGSRDAIHELIALGKSWTVQQNVGLGASSLAEIAVALHDIKRTLSRVERNLPELSSLAAIPLARWDLWRRIWKEPAAPPVSLNPTILVMADPAPLAAVLDCLTSIERQQHTSFRAGLISADTDIRGAVSRRASLAPELFLPGIHTKEHTGPRVLLNALNSPHLAETEWVAVAIEPLILDPNAIGWLMHAASTGRHVALFADEDTILSRYDPAGELLHVDPQFKGAPDPELLSQGKEFGSLVIARKDKMANSLAELIGSNGQAANDPSVWWPQLHINLLEAGTVGHVPYVLSSRIQGVVKARAAVSTKAPAQTLRIRSQQAPGIQSNSIVNVIILTRDHADLLQKCVDSLIATAEVPAALAITVIDNGSEESKAINYLEQAARKGAIEVLRRDEAFNWSRFNNEAVKVTKAPLLVFVNNDIEMISAGWDARLRFHLARSEIGALGARLLYPDRTIQHAAIVLGTGSGGTEHEGRNASADDAGPGMRWVTRRSVSAVTGAFLACRRSVFEAVDGFDATTFGLWYNDVDFCLRVRATGYRVLYEPAIEAYHHESKTLAAEFDDAARAAYFQKGTAAMRARWGTTFENDPYFNPHYARWGTPFAWLRASVSTARDC